MSASLGSMVATLVANTKPFEQKMRQASRDMKGFGSHVSKQNKELVRLGKEAVRAAASFIGFKAIVNVIKEVSQEIFRLAKNAQMLGMSVQQLASWEFAAKSTGTEVQNLSLGMLQLQKAVTRLLVGEGRDVNFALKSIGVSLQDIETLSPEEAFMRVIGGLSGVANIGERARLSMILFEDHLGQELLPMINQGADGVQNLLDEFNGLHTGIDKNVVASAQKLHKNMVRLDTVWQDFKKHVFILSGALLGNFVRALTALIEHFNRLEPGMQTFLFGLAAAVPAIIMLELTLTSLLLPALSRLLKSLKAIAAFASRNPFIASLSFFTMLFVSMGMGADEAGTQIEDLEKKMNDFTDAIAESQSRAIVNHIKHMEELAKKAEKWKQQLRTPEEIFTETANELVELATTIDDLTGSPFIDVTTFNRGLAHAMSQLIKAKDISKQIQQILSNVEAVSFGTMEEVRARLSARRQQTAQQTHQKHLIQLQKRANAILLNIAQNTGTVLPTINLVP